MMPHTPLSARPRARRAGFTLVELIVVISIIMILVGIGIAGAQQVRNSARSTSTRVLMQAMRNIAVEYDVVMETQIDPVENTENLNWADSRAYNNENYAGYPGTAVISLQSALPDAEANLHNERFVWEALTVEESANTVKRLGKSSLVDMDHIDANNNGQVEAGELGDGFLEVRDFWGTTIDVELKRYDDSRGAATIFTSAGPDGSFEDEDDNLSSLEFE